MPWAWGSGPGAGAADAAWQAGAHAECAKARRLSFGAVYFDCRRAYEVLAHGVVGEAASGAKFPAKLAKLALQQYMAPRAVRVASSLSKWTQPRKGIVAGCGLACHLLQCTLRPAAEAVRQAAPEVELRVVVDDAYLENVGLTGRMARSLAEAARAWMTAIAASGGEIHTGKTQVLANTPKARRALEKPWPR